VIEKERWRAKALYDVSLALRGRGLFDLQSLAVRTEHLGSAK